MQVKSHVVPAHDGVPFAGAVHATQVPEQRRKPALHATEHCWFRHTGAEFGSFGQTLQDDGPQLLTAVLGTQV